MIEETKGRRKFLAWGAGALTLIAGFRFFTKQNDEAPATTKMLTQDGKLVEVDVKLISQVKKKATNKEVQEWIKR